MTSNRSDNDVDATQIIPTKIGRYIVEKSIGEGGFGTVYLAYDKQLDRQVAIKVPHANVVKEKSGASEYVREAQLVANLDHPNIVPVYDVGSSDEFACFFVSKFIRGRDLSRFLARHNRFNFLEAVELVSAIADALHYAHKRGIVHRDVKPSNILLDRDGKPYLADFGLALPELSLGTGPRYAGTPAYMSPEQARGEGHRVDGRSDIFSLGTVLYELVTGKRAFRGDTKSELMDLVENYEPRPLRQYNEELPKELDRICHKALAKRANERYSTAFDMADELRAFATTQDKTVVNTGAGSTMKLSSNHDSPTEEASEQITRPLSENTPSTPSSFLQTIAVIPKGLRSFDSHDADYFLELLPGPRSREGLPENLRFWKDRIESMDPDEACSVGLIYGPSGCGKSSFVKAGLLPRLSPHVIPVFVECSAEFTEARLVRSLQKTFPNLNQNLDVGEMIATIRRGRGVPDGKKVLLVFDQFEQWLHAKRGEAAHELLKALRQCDGERVQAILLVRDDFWMAVTWFLKDLEVELIQGKNFSAVDLFPERHAEKVLVAFGRAYEALSSEGAMSPDQNRFIEESVQGLADNGKVMCVRLAVYAEMMKNRPWNLASLRKMGGTDGVGVSFLEDSFGKHANPRVRLHQAAARKVLKSLLPETGTLINVQIRSYEQLLSASGYSERRQFDDLLQALDGELRLISPTDPKGLESELEEELPSLAGDSTAKFYRLSHDYLITALRAWLERKQRETRRGRAELLLTEQTHFWRAKQTYRFLPSFVEHARIRYWTSPKQWNVPETQMMRAAAKYHGLWAGIASCVLGLLAFGIISLRNDAHRDAQEVVVRRILDSTTDKVTGIAAELGGSRDSADRLLEQTFENSSASPTERLHAAMALASESAVCRSYLYAQLPVLSADQFLPVCDALGSMPSSPGSSERAAEVPDFALWADDAIRSQRERLGAACALAQFAPTHLRWKNPEFCRFVADKLTQLFPSELAPLRKALQPVSSQLVPGLLEIFRDSGREKQQRLFATETLVGYQPKSPELLFDLLLNCDATRFPMVFRALEDYESRVIPLAKNKLLESLPADTPEQELDELALQQANAAVALYQVGQYEPVWQAMNELENPRVKSFLVHWLASYGSSPLPVLERLESETQRVRLQALILALGEFPAAAYDSTGLDLAVKKLQAVVEQSKTSDLVNAAVWSLNSLGQSQWVQRWEAEQLEVEDALQTLRRKKRVGLEQELSLASETTDVRKQELQNQVLADIKSAQFEGELKTGLLVPLQNTKEVVREEGTETDAIVQQPGLFGDALRFDGSASAKLTGEAAALELSASNAISFGCWFRAGSKEQYASLFSMMDPDQDLKGFDVWFEDGRLGAHVKQSYIEEDHPDSHYLKVTCPEMLADDQWHHAMVSYDGSLDASGVSIYIDGQLSDTIVWVDSLIAGPIPPAALIVGGRPEGNWQFTGWLSNVRVLTEAITGADVLSLYYADLKSLALAAPEDLSKLQAAALQLACSRPDPEIQKLLDVLDSDEQERVTQLRDAANDRSYSSQDHQMIRLTAREFAMGGVKANATDKLEVAQHTRSINRTFAISAKEVTIRQWQEFQSECRPNDVSLSKYRQLLTLDPEAPISQITWVEAVQYCNWLSEREGIPESQWCYVPDSNGQYSSGMQIKPNFWKLTGYRLPTEAEWEFACRGGSLASRFYGSHDSLLSEYAWFQDNSDQKVQPGGLKKPNAWGIYDSLGNASEWVFDSFYDYPFQQLSAVDEPSPRTSGTRTLRGGGFYDMPRYVSSSHRFESDPNQYYEVTGMRIARTLGQLPQD